MVVKERPASTRGNFYSGVETPVREPTVVYPSLLDREVLLEREWMRQANRLAGLFARELNKTRKEYIDELPKFPSQPERFRGKLDSPVIVETRIPIRRQLELAGIFCGLEGFGNLDGRWRGDPKACINHSSPCVVWMDKGVRNKDRKVVDVRKDLLPDERGGTILDGVALYIAHPDILNILGTRYLNLPGAPIEPSFFVSLGLWGGGSGVLLGDVKVAYPKSRALVCGRE